MKRSAQGNEIFSSKPTNQNFNDENATVRENDEINTPLPDEILSEIILKYVPLYRWSSCLEYVSKQFRRCVIIAYQRSKSINIHTLLPLKLNKEIFGEESVYCRGKRFRKLSKEWLDEILEKLLLVCPFLMELKGFQRVTDALDVTNCTILERFECLQSVYLEGLHIGPACWANFPKSLKNLKIFRCSSAAFNDWVDIATVNMENVVLCDKSFLWCRTISFNNFGEKLATLKLNSLRILFQTPSNVDEIVTKCPNLRALATELHDSTDFEIISKALPNLHKLTQLSLSIGRKLNIDPFLNDFCVSMASLTNRLELFELSYEYDVHPIFISEKLLKFLFTKCLRLRCLSLLENIEGNLNELPRLSAKLEKLSVICDASDMLSNVLQLSNLTDLNISGTNASRLQDLHCLEKLRRLRLERFSVTDQILETWATKGNKMFEKLVSLKISRCFGVTDVGACLLAKKAIKLESLELSSSQITDLTILTLAETAKRLKFVNFFQVGLIGDAAILQLIEKCVYLKWVKVNSSLAVRLVRNENFLPFVNDVEIVQCLQLC